MRYQTFPVELSDASNRNTPSKWIDVFGVTMLASYNTIVAAKYGTTKIRRKNTWGTTTGRHISEAGVKDWQVIDDPYDFNLQLRQMIIDSVLEETRKAVANEMGVA